MASESIAFHRGKIGNEKSMSGLATEEMANFKQNHCFNIFITIIIILLRSV